MKIIYFKKSEGYQVPTGYIKTKIGKKIVIGHHDMTDGYYEVELQELPKVFLVLTKEKYVPFVFMSQKNDSKFLNILTLCGFEFSIDTSKNKKQIESYVTEKVLSARRSVSDLIGAEKMLNLINKFSSERKQELIRGYEFTERAYQI